MCLCVGWVEFTAFCAAIWERMRNKYTHTLTNSKGYQMQQPMSCQLFDAIRSSQLASWRHDIMMWYFISFVCFLSLSLFYIIIYNVCAYPSHLYTLLFVFGPGPGLISTVDWTVNVHQPTTAAVSPPGRLQKSVSLTLNRSDRWRCHRLKRRMPSGTTRWWPPTSLRITSNITFDRSGISCLFTPRSLAFLCLVLLYYWCFTFSRLVCSRA
jgi:hypothetical protein